jgi:DNA-binding CsgD family transcriptional regulator
MKTSPSPAPVGFHLASLLEHLDQPAFVVDESHRTLYFNPGAEALRAAGPGVGGKEGMDGFLPRPQAELLAEKSRQALASGTPAELAVDLPLGGTPRPCVIRIVPVLDPAEDRGYLVNLVSCPAGAEPPPPPINEGAPGAFDLKAAELMLQRLEDLAAALEQDQEAGAGPAPAGEPLREVEKLAFPVLRKLRQTGLKAEERTYVDLIEKNLRNLSDPIAAHNSWPVLRLSPTELQIAQLVRDGKSSKEIASMLNLSKSTIHTHRQRIREKLGLANQGISLRSHLGYLTN